MTRVTASATATAHQIPLMPNTIGSINTAASAPVFDISGYGAVADFRSLVPALVKEIKKRKGID